MSDTLKHPPYGNWRVQNEDGRIMFRCDDRKARWYLSKGLAVSISPDTIRLTFKPKGEGHTEEFWLQDKYNVCVVCGHEKELTKHHVLPKCYRKYFPEELKSHYAYDVLVLCRKCHKSYESHADDLKKQLAIEYESPLEGVGASVDQVLVKVKYAAKAILKYRKKMPQSRIAEFTSILAAYCQKEIDEETIKACSCLDPNMNKDYISHGQGVIDRVTDLEIFARRWREHFVCTMNPMYMPEGWAVERSYKR